ncbi:MAG: DNRLRE domain-containing protein [Verrucomicrobiota bacterium]
MVFQPVGDTTLVELAPDNNLGGNEFVIAGTSGIGTKYRGLFKFDLRCIPPNSKIKSATLSLEVTGEPPTDSVSSTFELHRMLKNWGEGNKLSEETSKGLGATAGTNEATWNSPFAFTSNSWSFPGASNDFVPSVSSSAPVDPASGFPVFASNPQMVDDAQLWTSNPSTNFGWLLKSALEETRRTGRRFGSREFAAGDTNSRPFLEIEFVQPPQILFPQITNGQFRFSFLAESNSAYNVQFVTSLGSTNLWQTLTNISAMPVSTNILVEDMLSSVTRFYRVLPQ